MLIEAGILNGYEGVLQIGGDHIGGHRNPVGVAGNQFGGLIAVHVIDEGRKSLGSHTDISDFGGRGKNAAENTDPEA